MQQLHRVHKIPQSDPIGCSFRRTSSAKDLNLKVLVCGASQEYAPANPLTDISGDPLSPTLSGAPPAEASFPHGNPPVRGGEPSSSALRR